MFILYAIPLGILAGLALGGRLDRLGTLQFRWSWVVILGLAVQLVLFSEHVTERIGALGMPIYVLSTLAVASAIAVNRRIRGMPLVLLGAASNLLAIVANGGYMPASESALAALGRGIKGGYSNSASMPDPQLPWLTDIFALPSWLPSTNVFSIGDVFIGLGVVVVIASAMRSPVVTGAAGPSTGDPVAPSIGDPVPPSAAGA